MQNESKSTESTIWRNDYEVNNFEESAKKRGVFNETHINKYIKLAEAIAKIEGKNFPRIPEVAEAMQYVYADSQPAKDPYGTFDTEYLTKEYYERKKTIYEVAGLEPPVRDRVLFRELSIQQQRQALNIISPPQNGHSWLDTEKHPDKEILSLINTIETRMPYWTDTKIPQEVLSKENQQEIIKANKQKKKLHNIAI